MSSAAGKQVCAIFGLGRAGRIHFGNLQKLQQSVSVAYIVDADLPATRSFLGHELSNSICLLTPDEEDRVFADKSVTFCIISSPTFTHEAVIRKCIASGKHMFCEKPVAKNLKAIIECYKLAQQNQLVLHASFNRRYDPSFNEVKRRIPEVVGSLHSVRTCSRDSPLPSMEYLRTSGGFFHDCGVHDLDLSCWIVGDYPESVFAVGATHDDRFKEFNDYDTAVMLLKFPSGQIAHCEISRFSSFGYDQRLEAHGSDGMLASNNITDMAVTASTSSGVTSKNIQHSFPQRYAASYILSLELFIAAIAGDGDSLAKLMPPLQSINANAIADACSESARTGAVVKFVPITEL